MPRFKCLKQGSQGWLKETSPLHCNWRWLSSVRAVRSHDNRALESALYVFNDSIMKPQHKCKQTTRTARSERPTVRTVKNLIPYRKKNQTKKKAIEMNICRVFLILNKHRAYCMRSTDRRCLKAAVLQACHWWALQSWGLHIKRRPPKFCFVCCIFHASIFDIIKFGARTCNI